MSAKSTLRAVCIRGLLLLFIPAFHLLPTHSQVTAKEPMAEQLPDGQGKEIVLNTCTKCHNIDRIVHGRRYKDQWQSLVQQMISNGAALNDDDMPVLVDYLAKNFPGVARPEATVIHGATEATIKEWKIPNPKGSPHDPLVAPDGSVWFTSGPANMLGRLDPSTGEFKEYPVKVARSGPHGLVADKDGNIWFTASTKNFVGKVNPKTAEITQYDFPNPRADHPHTPVIDRNGDVLFTVMYGNMVGKVTVESGKVKFANVPTPRSDPYGMVMDTKGTMYFAESASDKLASIDPETMEITEYTLPNSEARPRRLAFTSDGMLWYGDYARGYLGRFDPKTRKVTEWPSPSGPYSEPYALTTVGNIVWYSETGMEQNTVVRFDPATQKFQTWLIPSGGGVVRNMMPDKDGNLWLACSGTKTIAEVVVKKN